MYKSLDLKLENAVTAQEVSVFNHLKGKLFRDGQEPVYVLEDGRFVVKRHGNWKAFKTLATLDKAKAKDGAATVVKLMRFYEDAVITKDVIDWVEKGTSSGKMIHPDGTYTNRPGYAWRLYDEKAVNFHTTTWKKIAELEAQILKLKGTLEDSLGDVVSVETFRDVQTGIANKRKS